MSFWEVDIVVQAKTKSGYCRFFGIDQISRPTQAQRECPTGVWDGYREKREFVLKGDININIYVFVCVYVYI